MYQLFKKLISGSLSRGRGDPVRSNSIKAPKFEKSSWISWLGIVRQFCRKPNTQVSPCLVSKVQDNRPYIQFNILGRTVAALLDTGASVCVIGKDSMNLVKQLNLKIQPSKQIRSITTADGQTHQVRGLVYLPIQLQDIFQVLPFFVVPNVPGGLIAGTSFCKAFKMRLNFEDDTWDLVHQKSSVPIHTLDKLCSTEVEPSTSVSNLSNEQREIAEKTVSLFKVLGDDRLGRTDKIVMSIDTGDNKPFKVRQYPFSPYLLRVLNEKVDEMLRLGLIEPSQSAWNSPVLLVKKPNKEYRFCFDGRRLNAVTKKDAYPLPRVDRILSMLKSARFISSIDLNSAFWQIPLDEASREKTAFSIPGRGLFQFRVMPFGLCNSAQTQQRLMDAVFGPQFEPNLFVYLDDIIIVSSTFEEHIRILKEVCSRLSEANLTVNLGKCQFFKQNLRYLGYVVNERGLQTDPDKIEAIVSYPPPTTTNELKRFLGLCSWYRRFIRQFSSVCAPLNELLKKRKKGQSIVWTDEAEKAFLEVKRSLVSAPVLSSPDFTKPFTLQCDASNTGLGGVLTQTIEGNEHVIAFASRSLSKAERNYSVTERELLALIFSIEKFRPYIEGTKFTVITDHYSLVWLNRLKEPTGRLARWAVKIQQYDFEMIHRKGKFHVVPDVLSRIPYEEATVNVVDSTVNVSDTWYETLRGKVTRNPHKFPKWKIHEDSLYKYVPIKSKVQTNNSPWKLVVPEGQRPEILRASHDVPQAAHLGFQKTLKRIQENYYWPKMRKDVETHIERCKICGQNKPLRRLPFGLMGKEKNVQFPFQIISVDLIGPMPRSKKGHTFLLVVSDWFTKFSLLKPLRKATAQEISTFMENQVFLVYGVPQRIIADNGTQFVSTQFQSLCKRYKVPKVWYTARYHPQANFVERNNQTIGTAIRSFLTDQHRLWDEHIPHIQFALNTATHEVTGFTPAFLNFGRILPISGEFYGKFPETSSNGDTYPPLLPEDHKQYGEELSQLPELYRSVRKSLQKAYRELLRGITFVVVLSHSDQAIKYGKGTRSYQTLPIILPLN